MSGDILTLTGISRVYGGGFLSRRPAVRAVDDVSLNLAPGEVLGIVGESGSGKSTLGRIAARIEPPTSGEVLIDGARGPRIGTAAWRRERACIQMIWQNPSRALDPRMSIAAQIDEAMAAHGLPVSGNRRLRRDRVQEYLHLTGLDGLGERFVHQLSGGQQQRAVIARALSLEPRLVVCDEAVSALDVSVQAQIINLLGDLRQRFEISYLFISHDLGVVRHISDRIAVMRRGKVVESGSANQVFTTPQHDYTRALLAAVPAATPAARRARDETQRAPRHIARAQGNEQTPVAKPRAMERL
ncbi:Oligopeptide transport system ATP-binding protein (plasmid) [Nitratireductor aquimarinus]|uniref:ATP-binding cassette domain-containing protein n=1 Tax=Nitratireductor aquimarinus TaxID=889300 RepID=UPI003B5AD752